jgi:hypothetical protein
MVSNGSDSVVESQNWRCDQMRARRLTMTAAAFGVIAAPSAIAVISAAPASADPGACVQGPWGVASACVDVPWVDHWVDVDVDRPRWHDGGDDD